jgi:23S rRNA (cytosine1962-C5)-methyltransferase
MSQTLYSTIRLREGRERSVLSRHPWIFSQAIHSLDTDIVHGDLVQVESWEGEALGVGTFSESSSIAVRLFAFVPCAIDASWIEEKIFEALERRKKAGIAKEGTDGYRVVFGEADDLPGIIIDRYREVFVIQLSTAGADRLRGAVTQALENIFHPTAIVERSDMPSRKEERLESTSSVLHGTCPAQVIFSEEGIEYLADPLEGQKTGFFLDQRPLRTWLRQNAQGRVLNLFSYSGALGVAAMKGEALSVLHVDASASALELCTKHAELHGFDSETFETKEADVFQYLGNAKSEQFDTVIVDPPAFIKSRKDMEEGRKAYHFLNRAAMRLVKPGGILISSSCSFYLSTEDLQTTLRRASIQNECVFRPLSILLQPADHPTSLYFPESSYLKTMIGEIRES